MKKIIVVILLFIVVAFFIIGGENKFGNYNTYKNSNFSSWKWDFIIKGAYKYISENRYYEAIEKFKEAIESGCKSPQILYDTMLCYVHHGNMKAGEKWLIECRNSFDEEIIKYCYYIVAEEYVYYYGWPDTALPYYEKSGNIGLIKSADKSLEMKNYDKAIDLYIKAGKNDNDVYTKVAHEALNNKDILIAYSYFKKIENLVTNDEWETLSKLSLNFDTLHISTLDKYYELALDSFSKTKKDLSIIYNDIADNAFNRGYYNAAIKYYSKLNNINKINLSKKELGKKIILNNDISNINGIKKNFDISGVPNNISNFDGKIIQSFFSIGASNPVYISTSIFLYFSNGENKGVVDFNVKVSNINIDEKFIIPSNHKGGIALIIYIPSEFKSHLIEFYWKNAEDTDVILSSPNGLYIKYSLPIPSELIDKKFIKFSIFNL
ncbi:MAG: hypothetical protein JXB50_05350 [Spirochaetes bacterium]|nr:hypothetical protein [Spirochaetota bacterium]